MKHIESYKIFETVENKSKDFFYDKVNHDLIQDLKDLSLELFDENDDLELVYSVNTEHYKILYGFYRTKDTKIPDNLTDIEREFVLSRQLPKDREHWTNYYPKHQKTSIEEYKESGLRYNIFFHRGEPGTTGFEVLKDEEYNEILDILRELYPDEKIEIKKVK